MAIPDKNTGAAVIGGTPVKIVSLLGPNADETNSPGIIDGNVRERIILADPLTGAPLDLQNQVGGGTVASVNGHVGVVVLTKSDIGLSNVDNTSDATKNSATTVLTNKTISGANNTLTVRVADLAITGTPSASTFARGDGTWATPAGSGTVTNTGNLTLNSLVVGNGTTDTKVLAGFTTDGTSKVTLGVAGTSVGKVALANATSGTVTLSPVTGALGSAVLSLPAATDTVAVLAAAQTFTNKTLTSPTLTAPVLGTPASGTLTNCTGLPIAGLASLGTGVGTFMATPTSANLAAAITDETGSGALVFGTSPTLTTPTLSGIVTSSGASVAAAAAMGALAIDVTKANNTKTIAADSTFTFSGTPANSDQWFGMTVTNSDTNTHILTFPSSFSLVVQAARTTCPIAASGQLWLMWRYDGSVYHVFGDGQYLNNFGATVDPTVTDDVTSGYGPGSLWGNTSANTLFWCETNGSGAAAWNTTGGSGTVTHTGNLTSNALVLGNGTADTKAVAGIVSDGTSIITLGVAGTSVGKLALANATSGSITVAPPTGALGAVTLTLPAATDTLVGKATTDTLTNKTLTSPTITGGTADTFSIGYKEVPQNSKSAAYTTVLSDSGKHILHPSADTTARTFTIDSNANVAYPIGTAITFVNQHSAGVMTIAITTDTMRLAGAGTTGSRTLAADGVATALKLTSTEWIISGTGLT